MTGCKRTKPLRQAGAATGQRQIRSSFHHQEEKHCQRHLQGTTETAQRFSINWLIDFEMGQIALTSLYMDRWPDYSQAISSPTGLFMPPLVQFHVGTNTPQKNQHIVKKIKIAKKNVFLQWWVFIGAPVLTALRLSTDAPGRLDKEILLKKRGCWCQSLNPQAGISS